MKHRRIVGWSGGKRGSFVVFQLENGAYAWVPSDEQCTVKQIRYFPTVVEAHAGKGYGNAFTMCDMSEIGSEAVRGAIEALKKERENFAYNRAGKMREELKTADFMEPGKNWVTDEDAYIELAKKEDAGE